MNLVISWGGSHVNTIENKSGFQFIDFLKVKETEINQYQPVAGSFAVIQCHAMYLLCYNKWRKQWELPADQREEGETAKECAIRELYEETGQELQDLLFKGLLKVRNRRDGNIKYNPVYFSAVKELQPFAENEEMTKIQLWDRNEYIGYIDEVDIMILDFL